MKSHKPRCPRCGYETSGLATPSCPECGCNYTERSAAIEGFVRRSRWRRRLCLIWTATTPILYTVFFDQTMPGSALPVLVTALFVALVLPLFGLAAAGVESSSSVERQGRRAVWNLSWWALQLPMAIGVLAFLGGDLVCRARSRGIPPSVRIKEIWIESITAASNITLVAAPLCLLLWAFLWIRLSRRAEVELTPLHMVLSAAAAIVQCAMATFLGLIAQLPYVNGV